MNCVKFVLIFAAVCLSVNCYELFDRYSGKPTNESATGYRQCSIGVKPCTPHEGSRIDGTCNNYKRPSRGSAEGPYLRLLKPDYGHMDYLRKRTYCCKPEGLADPRCAPIPVPHDDPYLRGTGIECMNYSRIETFQDNGCLPRQAYPEQINLQTPLIDLSTVYGVDDKALYSIRQFERGLLREERRKGRHVPLNETRDVCFQNMNRDPVCYKFGYPEVGNFELTTTTLTIFFYREHNRIARILKELNPCWKDDRLFKVARRINIATAANMFMYELLPVLLGYKNMVNFGLISEHVNYVSSYDDGTDPLIFAEYEIAKRFFHTFWEGRIKLYNEHYRYIGEFSLSDTLFRPELIEEGTHFEELNRGTFFQHAAKIDDIQDPDISEKFYSQSLKAHDRIAVDIQRGRDMGLQGYNSYRGLCGLKPAKKFEDFLDVMTEEKIVTLKKLYCELEDVDLLAGIMSEDLIPGTSVGPTLFCIMTKQLHVFRFSDRFWFERGDQYHSFTLPQLQEIRKTNMARFACDNAEGIKYIQPHALLSVGLGNEQVPCSQVHGVDLSHWKDPSCLKSHREEYYGLFNLGKQSHLPRPHAQNGREDFKFSNLYFGKDN